MKIKNLTPKLSNILVGIHIPWQFFCKCPL